MTTPAHHTAENWEQRRRRIGEFVVRKVEDHGDHVAITSEAGWTWMPSRADLGREIHVGERLEQETIGFSQVTGVRDANGWLYRRTNQELADEARRSDEAIHRSRVECLEVNRKKYAELESQLPEWLQARILRFRTGGGEKFLLSGWGYELVICRLADLFDRGLEAEAEQLSSDEGVTGNQWDCAKAIAAAHLRDEGSVAYIPAGLSPLTGSADYS